MNSMNLLVNISDIEWVYYKVGVKIIMLFW